MAVNRRHLVAAALLPERWVRYVKHLVRIERDGDVVDVRAVLAQPRGYTLHVGVRTGHGQ